MRAIPEALKPYISSLNLHLDIEIPHHRRAGYLIAACTPKLATTQPSSSIFHGTSITTALTDTASYAFLEVTTLFNQTTLSPENILSHITHEVADEIAVNSLMITRRITSPEQYQLLSFIFACPRPLLPRIVNTANQMTAQDSPLFCWATPTAILDDLTEQSDHLLITIPQISIPSSPAISLASHHLIELTHHLRTIVNSKQLSYHSIFPASLSSILLICPRDSIKQELTRRLPLKFKITNLLLRISSHLLRPLQKALMVHPIHKPGQDSNPQTMSQLGETLRSLFPTQTIESRQNGFRIHQLDDEIHVWRNFEGYLGPLKVRMGVEKEKQSGRDAWWARQDHDVRTEINDLRKKRMLHLTLSANTERNHNTEAETHPRIPSSEDLGGSTTAAPPKDQSKRPGTPLSTDRNSRPRLEERSSPNSPPSLT